MFDRTGNIIFLPKHVNVVIHEECRNDIERLLSPEDIPAFIASYAARIEFLSLNIGRETFLHRSWFEVLKCSGGFRSIRFVSIRNLRILYAIEKDIAYLLLTFEEKSGHRNTEYAKYIDVAKKRLSEKELML